MRIARRRGALSLALATVVAGGLAACSVPAAQAPTSGPSDSSTPKATVSAPEPSSTSAVDAEVSCLSILPEATVADFEQIGWSSKEEPFYVGGTQLEGGLQCTWGDYSVATDHVQIFGWAPITAAEAREAQQELVAGGWRREEAPDGVYITESEETAIATDAAGYGITYLFGDGWVTLADTKQGLVLVDRPES